MPQIQPISTILELAAISQYLADYDANIDMALNGGSLNQNLGREIYQARKNVEWMYANNSDDANLVYVGDYLYALCGKYISKAQVILGYGGGGVIITPSTPISTIQFSVGGSQQYAPTNGQTQYNNPTLANTTTYSIYCSAVADYLIQGSDFIYLVTGGFELLSTGRIYPFFNGTNFTLN
jgi:hypothetical protein